MKKGWSITSLGELCDILDSQRKPITKRDRVDGSYPYYGATGILDYVSGYLFDEPLVLVGEDGAKWASGDNTAFPVSGKCWVNNHAHVLRPNRSLLIDNWLIHFLIHLDLSPFVSGLTVPKLNQGSLREIPIPLPPLPEQQRIVAILDAAFASIATARANAEQNLKNARELFESHLQQVFSQKGEGWVEKKLGDVCDDVFSGGDAPKDNFSFVKTDSYNIPIYANAVKDKGLYGYTNFSRVTTPSITISARGSGTGHTEIRYDEYLPIVRLIVLIPSKPQIELEFLKYSIDNLEILRSGSAIPQLTVPMIKEYNLSFPSLVDQRNIIENLSFFQKETQRLTSLYQQKITALDELKKSLLHQAFSGAL